MIRTIQTQTKNKTDTYIYGKGRAGKEAALAQKEVIDPGSGPKLSLGQRSGTSVTSTEDKKFKVTGQHKSYSSLAACSM